MAKKYTPGPWRKGKYGPNGCYTIGTEKGLMVAMIAHSVNHYEQREQAEANALLISCAPELLEALEAAMDYINNCPCDPDIYPEQWKAWEKLNDIQPTNLIKKAKGG